MDFKDDKIIPLELDWAKTMNQIDRLGKTKIIVKLIELKKNIKKMIVKIYKKK
ncbi:MAG: hypothetical protein ABJB76_06850 [Candidatus Nitrosocosmicus sp.]